MKKIFLGFLFLVIIVLGIIWMNLPKITPYYTQLTKTRVGLNLDLQPKAQKEAHFVGSQKCKECHEEESHDWKASLHSKMIQDIKQNPSVVVADFTLAQAVYTIGSKFKQRYMIPAVINQKHTKCPRGQCMLCLSQRQDLGLSPGQLEKMGKTGLGKIRTSRQYL